MKDERLNLDWSSPTEVSRRRFLEAAGFSLSAAALGGCGRAPTEHALPFVDQPAGMIPGRTRTYAATCAGCPAACGLLVGVRDGRPLKMEGMPEHPLSKGGLCAVGQALPLGLYDSHRLTGPLKDGQPSAWEDVDRALTQRLAVAAGQGAVCLVTPTVTSPTLKAAIDAFLDQFDDARHVTFDAVSSSAILDAHQTTHGARLLPHVKLGGAQVIVSLGADFLGTWISPVEFTAAWSSNRAPTEERRDMSYHVQLEGRLSLTGSKADKRVRVSPDDYGAVLTQLDRKLSERQGNPGSTGGTSPLADDDLTDLADRLWDARGKSVVLCDSQDVGVQVLVNRINHTLENYGNTLDIKRPSQQRQGNDADVIQLIADLEDGKVGALLVAGTDLTHNLPAESLADAIEKVPLVVSFADRQDNFAAHAHFVCPDHHPLESWMDAEPVRGVLSLSQPTLAPLGNTRSVLESVARWTGSRRSAYAMIREHWEREILPRAASQPCGWDKAVHDGVVEIDTEPFSIGEFQNDARPFVGAARPTDGTFTVALYHKVGLPDSRHAHNPWLQELPDPITKATWDNYVCVSPAAAEDLGLSDGDVVRVASDRSTSVELPAMIQPGQHDGVVAVALNYGVRGTDRFAQIGPQWFEAAPTVAKGETVGKNAAAFIAAREGQRHHTGTRVTVTKTGRRHAVATTQRYHSLEMPVNVAPPGAEVREPVQQTTLAAFRKDVHAGTPDVHDFGDGQLWPEDHPKDRHWWGMTVDLNRCTGCSACLVACQSENNVPVVGKDEVQRQREMHWIRIDRYYAGQGDDVHVSHQPMMCQHCGNAPCETVCPVLATVHSEEGLNEQAYNRCVGTRYCANNCPYKVRRFNWFDYPHDDDLQNLVFNPDVTVRSRGVMEKCSMCVQRIEQGKIEARRLGEPVADGAIQTACQQSCPAQAITFGDMNHARLLFRVDFDPETAEVEKFGLPVTLGQAFRENGRPLPEKVWVAVLEPGHAWRIVVEGQGYKVRRVARTLEISEESRINTALADPRRYGVLEEFNFRPSVSYLRVVKNS